MLNVISYILRILHMYYVYCQIILPNCDFFLLQNYNLQHGNKKNDLNRLRLSIHLRCYYKQCAIFRKLLVMIQWPWTNWPHYSLIQRKFIRHFFVPHFAWRHSRMLEVAEYAESSNANEAANIAHTHLLLIRIHHAMCLSVERFYALYYCNHHTWSKTIVYSNSWKCSSDTCYWCNNLIIMHSL